MSIEREGSSPEPQEQQTPEYEFKSGYGERITRAVTGAVEYQKDSNGWSKEAEEPLREALSFLFDELLSRKDIGINDLNDRMIEDLASKTNKKGAKSPYESMNKILREEYRANFYFNQPAENTLKLLQWNLDSVEELHRKQEQAKRQSSPKQSKMRFNRE